MIDYSMAVKAIKQLLSSLEDETEVERYKTYTSIIHLIDEIQAILDKRGVEDGSVNLKIEELRTHCAQAAGLIPWGRSFDQYLLWSNRALESLDKLLSRLDFDGSFQ